MSAPKSAAAASVCDLRIDDDSGLVATGHATPRLSWKLQSTSAGLRQQAYEIEVGADPDFKGATVRSGAIKESRPYLAPWPAPPLKSREVRWWRVRAFTNFGETPWSEAQRLEATLFTAGDWSARPISPRSNVERKESGAAPLLRRAFVLDKRVVRARLYATALGLYEVEINGHAIGADVLEPGWTVYPRRLLFSTYDVTKLLNEGPNVICAVIGDGWYRGELSWNLNRNNYGATTALLAQLEIAFADGSNIIIATDESWRGSYGAVRTAELYHGTTLDLRLEPAGWRESSFDDRAWEPVVALGLPSGLEPRDMPAVRVVERRKLELPAAHAQGKPIRLDAGQNLTGYLAITAHGPSGARLVVRHAEVLDEQGALNTAPLRKARATDTYILDGRTTAVLRPPFTFHGFRYAEIAATPDVVIESVTAEVISSDLSRTGRFACSHDGLNRLYENALWSQRGNFIAVPTDCPQRDERLGWTGDIQVFAPTACANSDSRSFLRSWLKDLKLEQRDDGSVPVTIPDVISAQGSVSAAAAWGDAATVVPWVLYRAYGDVEAVRSQLSSMRAWVDWCASRTEADGTWSKDFQFGDWLDPDAPHNKPYKAKTHFGFVATSYLSFSAGLVARAEELFGDENARDFYRELQARSANAAWARWAENAMATPTGCALAIEFGIAPKELRDGLGEQLAKLIAKNEFRIGTGFVGTPLVLPALTRTGQAETAYRLLLNRDCPGWLYQVEKGATTIWERWDAVVPDSPLRPEKSSDLSSMISFNHYAYGAVVEWFYNTIAGLNIDLSKPPGEHFRLAPLPGGGLAWARGEIETPYGSLAVAWRRSSETLDVEAIVPPGASASLVGPPGYRSSEFDDKVDLGSGRHTFRFIRL